MMSSCRACRTCDARREDNSPLEISTCCDQDTREGQGRFPPTKRYWTALTHLRRPCGGRGLRPSAGAVIKRFGSWQRVCALLGQPVLTKARPKAPGEGQRWTDEAILESLLELRRQAGGVLSAQAFALLRSGHKGKVGTFPSYKTVLARFGSWARVIELLDQRTGGQ